MQAIAFALLKKAAPYLVGVGIAFGIGFYFGYHIGSDGIAKAKLALSIQQTNDAEAVAAENEAAATELVKANASANAAEATQAAAYKQFSLQDFKVTSQIAVQAGQPGQDAPDAPVLAHTLDALEGTP